MRKRTAIFSFILFLFSVFVIIGLDSCKKDNNDDNQPSPPTYTNGQGEIGEIGGVVKIEDENSPLNGVYINIPQGALKNSEDIIISEADNDILIPGDSSAIIVEFQPKGLTFSKPIEIGIPYQLSENDTSFLEIYYYDNDSTTLVQMPKKKVDVQNHLVIGYTDHFSYYTSIGKYGVKMNIGMLNVKGKIGARVFIEGADGKEGLKWVSNTFSQTLQGELNAWQSLTNSLNQVFSSFHVILYEDQLLGKDALSGKRIKVYRGNYYFGTYKAQVYDSDPYNSNPRFVTEKLDEEDINDNKKSLGNWFCGKPLIFVFDDVEEIDPDAKYFIKVTWALTSEPTGFAPWNYTPIYKFHNKKDKMRFSEMTVFNHYSEANLIDDTYQVWENNQEPECNFIADKTEVNINESIHFTDQSDYNPESWQWDFGDGNSSTEQNPTHQYSSVGLYTVSLEVSNGFGSDTKTKQDYITVTEGSYIKVITPNGNEEWTIGTEHIIEWEDNIDENVKIDLLKNSNVISNITSTTLSDGSYSWPIPESLEASNNYKIKITSIEDASINDISNSTFNLKEQGTITVTTPNSNTVWTMGQYNVPINWETGDLGGTVTIQMYKGENKLGTLIPDAPNNGSYTGYSVQTTLQEGEDYRVKIISNINEEKYDFSDYFEIIEAENLPPVPPYDPYPEEGEILDELTANLFWNCEDPEEDPLTYDVYAGENNPPTTLIVEGLTTNTTPYENLDEGTTYYWKVIAKDDHNNETASEVWWFETEGQGGGEDLIAYYPFNGNANDESGNELNGTVNNALLATDRFNNLNSAYYFDGDDDFITVSDNSLLRASNLKPFSWCFWIYPEENNKIILFKGRNGSNGAFFDWWIDLTVESKLRFRYSKSDYSSQSWYQSLETLPLNNWSFVVITYTFSVGNQIKIYFDGNIVDGDWVNGNGNHSPYSSSQSLYLGKHHKYNGSYGNYDFLKGKLDDIRIFNRILDHDEIIELFYKTQK